MKTGEELGYQDAIRQVLRHLQRRNKTLEAEQKKADENDIAEIQIRLSEVEHMIHVVESLHR